MSKRHNKLIVWEALNGVSGWGVKEGGIGGGVGGGGGVKNETEMCLYKR